jgi:type I restriction enzyme, S subunit
VAESTYQSWMTRGIPRHGDVLFTTEAPMGMAAVVEDSERFALAQRAIDFQPYADLLGRYLMWMILSPWFQSQLREHATGMTAQGIKGAKLRQIRVSVPPLPEQHRIVAKVDELMGLLDRLEQRLRVVRDTQAAFAAAAVQGICGENCV